MSKEAVIALTCLGIGIMVGASATARSQPPRKAYSPDVKPSEPDVIVPQMPPSKQTLPPLSLVRNYREFDVEVLPGQRVGEFGPEDIIEIYFKNPKTGSVFYMPNNERRPASDRIYLNYNDLISKVKVRDNAKLITPNN